MKYRKTLVARHNPKNKCYGEDGEWLIVGQSEHVMTGKLPDDHHFFVGVNTSQPSRYGWVKSLGFEISPEDLAKQYQTSPTEEFVKACGQLLESIKNQDDETPMACTLSTIGIIKKKRVMKVHKVLFYKSS